MYVQLLTREKHTYLTNKLKSDTILLICNLGCHYLTYLVMEILTSTQLPQHVSSYTLDERKKHSSDVDNIMLYFKLNHYYCPLLQICIRLLFLLE